ncbi:TetR/AcrR family transcriptional regulator [Nocardioides anomalus]|uniref:TetR/AcrR family transcriptional regulator n=1 Tax=Nocardioides anomalus TaxID=2712223 RepID=A0A6G6WFT8_9ACTN|nr:TetR/AcrR family transcriptional regulator [Nocardioides anomalus]QIG43910.1 TetR/AcrR family transcriptional regulator [Nocardioides anomalus]
MAHAQATTRPGGRSSRVLAAIHTAVGELVAEGSDKMTFPLIAARAGVNPTTLYRRWADVDELLEETAVAALTQQGGAVPDTGTLEGDLSEWATLIARDITRPVRVRYLRAMVGARADLVTHCPVTERRTEQAAEMLRRAEARGEEVPTVAQVLDHVVAPLYYRVTFALPVDEDHARRLARDVLAMRR